MDIGIFSVKENIVIGVMLIRVARTERNSNVLSCKYYYFDYEILFTLMIHNPIHIFI